MKSMKKYVILSVLFVFGLMPKLQAQSDLEINKVFDQYGKQKGAVMVTMTKEMLEGYDFSYFKSITIRNNDEAGNFIRQCLIKDEKGAKKVKQVLINGVPASLYLQFPKKGSLYRLILFNEARKPEEKITLIYIESQKDSEEVLKLILKKK